MMTLKRIECALWLALIGMSTVFAFTASTSFAILPATSNGGSTPLQPRWVLFSSSDADELTLDEEVEEMVQSEMSKTNRLSNLRNDKGVEYAPWMKISEQDEVKIRAMMREKAEARRKRQSEQQTVTGSLFRDSAYQELSGTGIKSKIIAKDDGTTDVELQWATSEERDSRGFMVKRRATKTTEFITLASYETFGPLASKGGGVYRYLDENVSPGGWFYRIAECEGSGEINDLSQCLVEIATEREQQTQTLAMAGFGVLAAAALIAGFAYDPVQY